MARALTMKSCKVAAAVIAFTMAASVVLTQSKSQSAQDARSILTRAKAELAKPAAANARLDFSRIAYMAEDAARELKLPAAFKQQASQLKQKIAKGEYSPAAELANRMDKSIPYDHLVNGYPIDSDFKIEWRVEIGNLRADSADYVGALREYDLARTMQPVSNPNTMGIGVAAYANAAWGQARMHTLLGNKAKALKHLEEAPGLYFSGCGNCMESEAIQVHRQKALLAAYTRPPAEAERALLRIIDGGFKPYPVELSDNAKAQVESARIGACLLLGELYLKLGKREWAKQAFQILSLSSNTQDARIAQQRLKYL